MAGGQRRESTCVIPVMRKSIIGLFQNKDAMVANISTFSSLEKRPNIDFHNVFIEEKVNNTVTSSRGG